MSYRITVAGGQIVGTKPDPGKAALVAKPLVEKGYTAWIRDTDSLNGGHVAELRMQDGEIVVTCEITPEPGWVTKARRLLGQL